MADLTVVTSVRAGVAPGYVAAGAGGDQFVNSEREIVLVKNDDASAIDVTITTVQQVDGLAVADRVVNVPAGETRAIGPFKTTEYADPATSKVSLAYSAVANITVAVVKLGGT